MDHSVEGYIQRLSSEELAVFLQQCMLRHQWDDYSHIVPQIIAILQDRQYPLSKVILDDWAAFQQKCK